MPHKSQILNADLLQSSHALQKLYTRAKPPRAFLRIPLLFCNVFGQATYLSAKVFLSEYLLIHLPT